MAMNDSSANDQVDPAAGESASIEGGTPPKKGLPAWLSVLAIVVVLAVVGFAYMQLTKEKPMVQFSNVKTKPSSTPPAGH